MQHLFCGNATTNMGMQLSFSGKMHYICNRKTIKTENMNHVTAHTIYRYFPSGVQPFNWGGISVR